MYADSSVEIGPGEACLEMPWASEDGRQRFVDLKLRPESIEELEEARRYPELREMLVALNRSERLQTAKCDVWASADISAEEEIFGGRVKFGCYVDVVFTDESRASFETHERFAGEVARRLGDEADFAASAELVVRRCYFEREEGFYVTVYVFGYGHNENEARANWGRAATIVRRVMTR